MISLADKVGLVDAGMWLDPLMNFAAWEQNMYANNMGKRISTSVQNH